MKLVFSQFQSYHIISRLQKRHRFTIKCKKVHLRETGSFKDKDIKEKEALFNVTYNVRDNITSRAIGGFRNSQSDVIFAHAHIRGRQRFVQLYGICVKCGFIF